MVSITEKHPVIGRQLFDVITSGMYDNPLMIFREYVQNSADSIDLGIERGELDPAEAFIQVTLSGQDRNLIVIDNGPGLSNESAHTILRSLGCSPKEGTSQRGFRGIGRLGGLAYCDRLIFETRSKKSEKIAVISWDRLALDSMASDSSRLVGLLDTIEQVSSSSFRDATHDDPEHFFKVTLQKVQRFHSDVLMNLNKVSEYLAQVAPVPFDAAKFTFAEKLNNFISEISDYRVYRLTVNNRTIFRPYTDEIQVSTSSSDVIQDVVPFTFTGADSTPIALGWYAKTGLIASLPQSLNMRGLRIRQGNIEIGDERFLDDKFTERRFASWHIGEIHVIGNRLKPNARRDGFEQSPDFERFLEQAFLLGRLLSSMCRKSSTTRAVQYKVEGSLQKLETLFSSPVTYIDKDHYDQAQDQAAVLIQEVEKSVSKGMSPSLQGRLDSLKSKAEDNPDKPIYLENVLDGRKLKPYSRKSLLKHVANIVVSSYDKSESAEDLLKKIFDSFTNEKYQDQPSLASLGLPE
jgi:hypothetical protein